MNRQHLTPDLKDLTYTAVSQTMNATCKSVESPDKFLPAAKSKWAPIVKWRTLEPGNQHLR